MRSRGSLLSKIAKVFFQLPFDNLLWIDFFCQRFVPCSTPRHATPIFLLAVPRGGSTLAYQCFIHQFRLNYFSNLWHLFYKLPFLGGVLSGVLTSALRPSSQFSSVHGFVPGMLGPAEGLHFWSRWFSCGLTDVCANSRWKVSAIYLAKTLRRLQALFPPFISCYLGHSLCIDRLVECYPYAVFVRVKRDPVRNALSILKARRQLDINWFSILPDECRPYINRSEHFSVAAQCYFLNKRIDRAIHSSRCFVLHYEDLCRDPARVMSDFNTFAERCGLSLLKSHDLPSSFSESPLSASDEMDVALLQRAFAELELLQI